MIYFQKRISMDNNDQNNPDPSCPTCLFAFKNKQTLNQHKCLITFANEDEEPDFFVREEEELSRLMSFINFGFSSKKLIHFCETTKTAIPGLYPLFFPVQRKNSYPVLSQLGNVTSSYDFLRKSAGRLLWNWEDLSRLSLATTFSSSTPPFSSLVANRNSEASQQPTPQAIY